MKNDSKMTGGHVGACVTLHKPCAGGVTASSPRRKPFDPTAWYVAEVRHQNELRCQELLSRLAPSLGYQLETYVATQDELVIYANRTRRVRHHLVIPGKIFIRVDEQHRQDVLKQCMLLVRYLKDPASVTANNFTDFMRVPDKELSRLRLLLDTVQAPVEYIGHAPRKDERVQVLSGPFHGLKGVVTEDGTCQYATVTLDMLGTFRFRMSTRDLGLLSDEACPARTEQKRNNKNVK